ncbi:MAG: DAK2 domain-containing protein [Bacilli bacterium]
MKAINGQMLKLMLISGSNNLYNHYPEIDALNVFPVPDGDTGMNMNLTLTSGTKEIMNRPDNSCGVIAKVFSRGLLMGARGNSGVITSQIFRGFAQGLDGKENIDVIEFASALQKGTEVAYKAVVKPVEGTILTVIRETSQFLIDNVKEGMTFDKVMSLLLKEANESLLHTPDLLPILKEVGVVDSGGAGLIKIFEGMRSALNGRFIERSQATAMEHNDDEDENKESVDNYEMELRILLDKGNNKKNYDETRVQTGLSARASDIKIYSAENEVNISLNSKVPGNVLNYAHQFGEFASIRIENKVLNAIPKKEEVVNKPRQKYALIAVSSGSGIDEYFSSIGVSEIVKGGQTMNPSAEDFLAAIKRANADNIFIFPNNSNIVMAASQACDVLDDESIHAYVIPSKTIPQGITSAINFNPEETAEENFKIMKSALRNVKSGEITTSIRDTEINGISVKKDEYIAIMEKNIVATGKSRLDTTISLVEMMVDDDNSIITVLVGQDVDEEEKKTLKNLLEEKFADLDIDLVDGNQPVYPFLIGVE